MLARVLAQPIRDREIELVRLEDGRLSSLQRSLSESEYHVLHFGGHIHFDTARREGVLLFEDEKVPGSPREVTSAELGTSLYDHGTLHLVVLNGCEGARTSTKNPSGGVAQKLVQLGVPIVIAMQFDIVDATAKIFADSFYNHIARHASIDTALSYARRSIMQGNDIEWGTPTLYSGHSDDAIFDIWGSLKIGKRLQDEEDRKVKARLKAEKDEADRVAEAQRQAAKKQAEKLLEDAAAARGKRNRIILTVAAFSVLIASAGVAVKMFWQSPPPETPHHFTDVEIKHFYDTRADEQSQRSLKKAALQDHNLYAQHLYGKSLTQDKPSESLPVEVLQGWQAAAENRVTDAAVDLGLYYVNRHDLDSAIKNYEKAIANKENAGGGKLAFAIGQSFENGSHSQVSKAKPDLIQALVYFKKADSNGNVDAKAAIGRVKPGAECQEYEIKIKEGEGGDLHKKAGHCAYKRKDWDSAIAYYAKARESSQSDNEVNRCYATALCLTETGVAENREKARRVLNEKSGYSHIAFDPIYADDANKRCPNLSSTSSGQINKP